MQQLFQHPELLIFGFLACLVGWIVLRGPKVFFGLRNARHRQREIQQRREMFTNLVVEGLRGTTAEERDSRNHQDADETRLVTQNLKQNWAWLLAGFGFIAVGVLSLVSPDALEGVEFVGRRRWMGLLLQACWGWPIGLTGLVFGLLCVLGSFLIIDD